MSSHSTSSLFHIVYKQSCNFSNNKLVLPHRFDSNESLRAATSSDNARNRSSSHFLITNFPFWFIPFPFELASHRSCLERSELPTSLPHLAEALATESDATNSPRAGACGNNIPVFSQITTLTRVRWATMHSTGTCVFLSPCRAVT